MTELRNSTIKPEIRLNFDNFVAIYNVLCDFSTEISVEQCLRFLDSNAEELIDNEIAFSHFPLTLVKALVTRDTFRVEEWRKCKAMIQWYQHNVPDKRKFDVIEFVRLLRWDKISVNDFKLHIRNLNVITPNQYVDLVPTDDNSLVSDDKQLAKSDTSSIFAKELIMSSDEDDIIEITNVQHNASARLLFLENVRQMRSRSEVKSLQLGEHNRRHETKHELAVVKPEPLDLVEVCMTYVDDNSTNDSKESEQQSNTESLNDVPRIKCEVPSDKSETTARVIDNSIKSPLNPNTSANSSRGTRTMWYNEKTVSKIEEVIENGTRKFVCTFCKKPFPKQNAALGHVATVHLKEKPFRCEYCNQCFSQKCNLQKHIQCMHEKPFQCKQCKESFNTLCRLTSHGKRVHEFDVNLAFEAVGNQKRTKLDSKNPVPSTSKANLGYTGLEVAVDYLRRLSDNELLNNNF